MVEGLEEQGEGCGWICIGSGRYLPMVLDGKPVLLPAKGPQVIRSDFWGLSLARDFGELATTQLGKDAHMRFMRAHRYPAGIIISVPF